MHILKSSTYVLEITKSCNSTISIGALGTIDFKKGVYLYVGSAKLNMFKRIQRHLRRDKRIHWHIDYLLKETDCEVSSIYLTTGGECETARKLHRINATRPVPGFGCSDCKCISHLFYMHGPTDISKII